MKNLKFFTLLRSMDEKEVALFYKYLKQQHEKDDIPLKIFEYAKKHLPDPRDDKKLELSYAYRKIFGADLSDNEHNRKKMLNALSDLNLWLKDFLLCEKVRQDSFESKALWLGILQERGLDAEFSKQATRLYEEARGASKRDVKDFLLEMVAGYFYYQHLTLATTKPDSNTFQAYIDSLETCAEIARLKMDFEMTNLKKVRPSEGAALAPDFDHPEKPAAATPTLLLLYREIHQLVHTEQETHFSRLKIMLTEHAKNLEPVELHGILRYLYNFAAIQIRDGKEAIYAPTLHPLNKLGLEHGFFTQKGVMSATEFANIVNVACTVKDFDWVLTFIKELSPFLSDDIRNDAVALAHALLCFEKKQYDKVPELLDSTQFRDILFVIRSRSLMLRSYFELKKDINLILDYCTAFNALLSRVPKPRPAAVEATQEFIRVFKMLLLEKTDQEIIIDTIEKNPRLYFRTWLLAHAHAYKARYPTRKRGK